MRRTETRSQRALRLEGDTPKCLAFDLRPFLTSLVFGSSLPNRTLWPFFLMCSEPGWPLLTVALGSAPPSRQAPLMGEAVVHGAQARWFKQQKHSLTISKSDLWVASSRPTGIILTFPCLHWPPVSCASSSCKGASPWTERPLISRMIPLQEPYLIVPGETFFPRKVMLRLSGDMNSGGILFSPLCFPVRSRNVWRRPGALLWV